MSRKKKQIPLHEICCAWLGAKGSNYFFIFISCRKDIVLPPPLLCRDITEADMIADAVSNNQLISVQYNNMYIYMYHPIAATCPSDMVVRVRKVLANRGLPRGCIVWPFGPRVALSTEKCKRYINILLFYYFYYNFIIIIIIIIFVFLLFFLRVRELKGLDLRSEPLRIIFLFIPPDLLNSFSVIVLLTVYSLWLQVMWFSSGGTKSVLHLDDGLDNINCLFRGTKELLFIDYQKYKHVVR